MAEKNEYFTQKLENGTLQISEDVVASVAAAAVLEVEGIRLTSNAKDGTVKIECDVVAKFGQSVFSLAKTVQDNVKTSVESITGLCVSQVDVNICGIAMPRELKK